MKNYNKTKLSLLEVEKYNIELSILKIEDLIEDIRSINDYRNMKIEYLLDKKIDLQQRLNIVKSQIHILQE